MQTQFTLELYKHMEWADATVWRATMNSTKGVTDPYLQKTLMHMHGTQRAFLDVWHQRPVEPHEPDDFPTATDLHLWARSYYPLARTFLEKVSDRAFTEVIDIPWTKYFMKRHGRPAGPVTLAETAYQVVAHSMHHRGQANRRLRELGGEPPVIDYIIWLWHNRPEPEWPENGPGSARV